MGLMERLGLRREPVMRVRMVVSVAEYVAGQSYDIPVDLADRFIARNYAEGSLSRAYGEDELQGLRGSAQVVRL